MDERNYSYDVQLKISLASNAAGLLALVLGLIFSRSHVAFLVSLFAQALVQVTASHTLTDAPYRASFFSPFFAKAFHFGYPLVLNGVGLAASQHGDRFLVGSLLGLPQLGVYAVVTLTTIVPLSMVGRIVGTVVLAQLYNAVDRDNPSYAMRLRLYARLLPLVAAFYALGVICLANIVVPLVFGAEFVLTPVATALLGVAIFLRQARGDPFTGVLLHEGRTKRLAIANLSSASALIFELALLLIFRSFEAVMAGRLLGEAIAMVVTLTATRDLFRPARSDFFKATSLGFIVLFAAIVLGRVGVGLSFGPSIAAIFAGLAIFGGWALSFSPAMLEAGFPRLQQKAAIWFCSAGSTRCVSPLSKGEVMLIHPAPVAARGFGLVPGISRAVEQFPTLICTTMNANDYESSPARPVSYD